MSDLERRIQELEHRVTRLEHLVASREEQRAHVEAHKELERENALLKARVSALESQVVMLNGNAENGGTSVH